MENGIVIPIWEKYALSVEESAAYFQVGENRLREIINENPDADFWFARGNRKLIKRVLFEKYMDVQKVV